MKKKRVLNALVAIIVLVSIQMAHADLKNGLLAYYPFNGNANDESGNGNNGTVNDATLTMDRFDNYNASYVFNNDPNISIPAVSFIKIQDSLSLKPDNGITISIWIKALNEKGRTIIGKQYETGMKDSYVLWYDSNGTVGFSLGDGTNPQPRISASLPIDKWSHIVGVWDGSSMKLYIDSVEVAVLPFSGKILYDSNPVFIGADNNNNDNIPDEGWNGFIDDIRIYNRDLSESEIQELYEEQPCNCPDTGYEEGYQAGKQACIDDPLSCGIAKYLIFSNSANPVIQSGSSVNVYGNTEINRVTLKSGASAKLINFVGNNEVTVQAESTLFSVHRSGATVTFEDTNGTTLTIPATKTLQSIIFNDIMLKLVIEKDKVMLGNQVVKLTPSPILL